MAQTSCLSGGRNGRASPIREYAAALSLLILLMGGSPVIGEMRAEEYPAFELLHVVLPSAAVGVGRQWEQQELGWSKNLHNAGVAMRLVHRDALSSALPAFRTEGGGKENRLQSIVLQHRLQRDAARVQALNSMVTCPAPARQRAGLAPPLKTPVVSGLDEGSGEYFATMSVGSPAVDVLVTMDTGSDLLWIQCHPCDNCYNQVGPIFNPAASKTYEVIQCYSQACEDLPHSKCVGINCEYDVSYGDGSFTTGEFARETLTMNSTKGKPFLIPNFFFGCGHDNEGLFVASAGLLGLGRGDLSLPQQISSLVSPRFSYCLTDRFVDVDRKSSSYLFFGESETSHMQFTNLLHNPAAPSFYYVQLTGLSVAKKLLQIPTTEFELDSSGRGGVILDSGTSVTRLPSAAYTVLRDEFRSRAQNLKRIDFAGQDLFDTCYQMLKDELVPVITLHFAGDSNMVLPPDNILIPVDDTGTLYCLAFAATSSRSGLSIIGNVQQQGFRIEFDLAKLRVGFTRIDCAH